ncbi:MAG TPA: DUF4118 domain-containing protein, partial [Candidatus Solibacter sp.]|nr:DUF4118 domain-containing protein [Candidatus Solibacter sp.]
MKRSPLHGSVFALALTTLALVLTLLIRPFLEPALFLLFLVAVLVSALYHGRTGGFTATVAAAIAIGYFFLRPGLNPTEPAWALVFRFLTFLVFACVITWVTASWRTSSQLLSATLNSIGDAVLATDRDGCVSFLNPVAETLTGWTRSDARGKSCAEILRLIDEKTRAPLENPLDRAIRERAMVPMHDHTALVSRNGVEVPIEHS